MNQDSIFVINHMNTEELIQFINDNIDDYQFKYGKIVPVDDIEYWENLGEYLGGYMLMDILSRFPRPKNAKYCQYDSEQKRIYWYATKKSIISTVTEETLCELYECSLD